MVTSIRSAILLAVFVVAVFTSCEQKQRSDKVRSIGNTSEILVVVENEQQWDGMIGKTIRETLGREQYGLNQAEPFYNLAHVSKTGFSDLLKKHRNLLIIDIDKNVQKPRIESVVDEWSKPQQIIRFVCASSNEFVELFNANVAKLEEKFNKTERERILSVFRTSSNNKVTKKVKKTYGFRMTIPRDYMISKTEPGFMWIRKETVQSGQGMIIMAEPYLDTAQFSMQSIVARANRYMEQYVPGPMDGSYMKIDDEYIVPVLKSVNDFPLDYALETRGLWKVENDFMGGPFVGYSFLNPKDNQIVTIIGYVYNPNKRKRDLLRQMESMIYSIEVSS
jgi:hypothetical protein